MDNIKGFLIILVVFGHVIQDSLGKFLLENEDVYRLINSYIYSFHIPLFMAVSGFVNYKSSPKLSIVGKRAIQLLVPFVVWAFIKAVLYCSPKMVVTIIVYPDRGLWFLQSLFFIILIVNTCEWLSSKLKGGYSFIVCVSFVWIFLSIISMLFGEKRYGIPLIGWNLPFYLLGYWIHKYNTLNKLNKLYGIVCMAIFLILANDNIEQFYMSIVKTITSVSVLNQICYRTYEMAVASFAIVGWLWLFKTVFDKQSGILTYLGRKTIVIYSVTLTTIGLYLRLLVPYTNPSFYPLFVIFLSGWMVMFSIAIQKGTSWSRILRCLLWGERS